MTTRPWSRGLAGLLGLWLTFVWAGPNARINCPMHVGAVAIQEGGAGHGHHASHGATTPDGDHDTPDHQGCNCTWCPSGGREAVLDTAVLPAAPLLQVGEFLTRLPAFRSAVLPATPHQLPFANGPPTA